MCGRTVLLVGLAICLALLQQVQALPRSWSRPSPHNKRSSKLHARATTIPDGWAYTDCVTDTGNPRGLQGYSFDSSVMTVNLCITTCQSKGFVSRTSSRDSDLGSRLLPGSSRSAIRPSMLLRECHGCVSSHMQMAFAKSILQRPAPEPRRRDAPCHAPEPATSSVETVTNPAFTHTFPAWRNP